MSDIADPYTLWLRLYDARIADWKTNEEQLAKVAAIIEADREEAARAERARILDLINGRMSIHNEFINDCVKHDVSASDSFFIALAELRSIVREIERLSS